MKVFRIILVLTNFLNITSRLHWFRGETNPYEDKYGYFSEKERIESLEKVRNMFYFGYDNYMKYAFPEDELNPIYCKGRGHDHDNPSNININDVLGDYMLTLVDTLDTLVIMGNATEFKKAVHLVIDNLDFNKPVTVQVFEATIRRVYQNVSLFVLRSSAFSEMLFPDFLDEGKGKYNISNIRGVVGSLLSAHLIITDPQQPFGDMIPEGYDNELLSLANDLAVRLLPAFENTATGIPFPRVNLSRGVPINCVNETCTSGAGTLVLEFGLLSRLLGDPIYEAYARRAVKRLWEYRSNITGLLGNVINIQTGEWTGQMSGLGAGLDSFYEYLLKAFILFGEEEDLKMFKESYETIKFHMKRGRLKCNKGEGHAPLYVNVHMRTGDTINNWVDSLQAAWPGVQVLNGDIDEAICTHALFYSIWRKYSMLPERYNWYLRAPDVSFYPLRPELVESTYFLYRATKNPFYLHVGKDILHSLLNYTKAECGFGTVHDVIDKSLEDRMESFFLSETCKYLYLLFDKDNHVNRDLSGYIFNTEGHLIPVSKRFRYKPWEEEPERQTEVRESTEKKVISVVNVQSNSSLSNCQSIPQEQRYFLPMRTAYFEQMQNAVGVLDII